MSNLVYTQLPPDGTGKKMVAKRTIEIEYSNPVFEFQNGDRVTTDSGLLAIVILNDPDENELYLSLPQIVDTNTLVPGEPLKVNDVVYATYVGVAEDVLTQTVMITSGDNSLQAARIDPRGALLTSFASGDPLFDAFGKMSVAETTTIREYISDGNNTEEDYDIITEGNATTQFNNIRKVYELNTGTLAGDKVRYRTHLYHRYQVGVSSTILFSGFMDSHSKTNCEKRVGVFDDNDGLFFHSDGTGVMGVVVRSSTSGSIVEKHIHQNEWNVDRLDGQRGLFNISGIVLDPTKTQVFFIDYQWLGAGRVRFGFFIDGYPIVCHQINNANNEMVPYMRTGTLPLTFEIENVGPVSSSNTLSIIAAAVKCEGKFTPREKLFGSSLPNVITINSTYSPIASYRAKQFLISGEDNRMVVLPTTINVSEITSTNKPWLLELVKNDTLNDMTFTDIYTDSGIEMNASATTSTGGQVLMSWIITGEEYIDLTNYFNYNSEIIIRKATIVDTPTHYTIRAKTFDSTNIQAVMSFNWKEYR